MDGTQSRPCRLFCSVFLFRSLHLLPTDRHTMHVVQVMKIFPSFSTTQSLILNEYFLHGVSCNEMKFFFLYYHNIFYINDDMSASGNRTHRDRRLIY